MPLSPHRLLFLLQVCLNLVISVQLTNLVPVIGTGLIGWLLNIVVVLCSGPLENLPGASGLAFLEIMHMRIGRAGALFLWYVSFHPYPS